MLTAKQYREMYPFWVRYRDNATGIISSESWSEKCLERERKLNEVEILEVTDTRLLPEDDD